MRKLFMILACLLASKLTFSQNNPFESIGKEAPPTLTLSNGKYEEFFDNDSLRQVGSVIVNILRDEVVGYLDIEKSPESFHPYTSSRFLSIDPLARKFPNLTPYQYASNRPIDGIDLDGAEFLGAWYKGLEQMYGKEQLKSSWAGQVLTGIYKNYTAMGISDAAYEMGKGQVNEIKNHPWTGILRVAYPMQLYQMDAQAGAVENAVQAAKGNGEAQVNLFAMGMGAWAGFKGSPLAAETEYKFTQGKAGSKTIVIGQGMNRVKAVAGEMNAEVFQPSKEATNQWNKMLDDAQGGQISDKKVQGSLIYQENQTWISNAKKAGANIVDVGSDGSGKQSTFYNMEKEAVYGEAKK